MPEFHVDETLPYGCTMQFVVAQSPFQEGN
jgi:hypothetical protein